MSKKELLLKIQEFKGMISKNLKGKENSISIIKNSSANEGFFFKSNINESKDALLIKYNGLKQFVDELSLS